MKNKELYNKTVDILVQAYFNDTLEHGSCQACAVGNLIAGNCGLAYDPQKFCDGLDTSWYGCFGDVRMTSQTIKIGYTQRELTRIENAFENRDESNRRFCRDADPMFSGLMAVIDVLDQIHENTDQEVTKVSKQKFVKA